MSNEEKNQWRQWKGLGLPFGLMFGVTIGAILGTFSNQAMLCIPIGAAVGVSLGIILNRIIASLCKTEEEKQK